MPETGELVMHVQHRDAMRASPVVGGHRPLRRGTPASGGRCSRRPKWRGARPRRALDEHAEQIKALEEHLTRHEQVFHDHGRMPDDAGSDPLLDEHREFDLGHAGTRKAHEKMQRMYQGVMSEALELMKLTHPGAIVRETVA